MLQIFGGVEVLDGSYTITADDFEEIAGTKGIQIEKNDIALIRTGWANYWNEPDRFVSNINGTLGPGLQAARWLRSKEIFMKGSQIPWHLKKCCFICQFMNIY